MSHELIKKFEGFRERPYYDEASIPTIGYGTTIYPDGVKVTIKDRPITESYAAECLDYWITQKVSPYIKKYVELPLNRNEREAVESFIYNLGGGLFIKSSLLKLINSGKMKEAAEAFKLYNKVTKDGKKVPSEGLTKRRQMEARLFLTPAYKQV